MERVENAVPLRDWLAERKSTSWVQHALTYADDVAASRGAPVDVADLLMGVSSQSKVDGGQGVASVLVEYLDATGFGVVTSAIRPLGSAWRWTGSAVSPEARAVLEDALALAHRLGDGTLRVRHLIAALLRAIPTSVPDLLGSLASMRRAFLAYIGEDEPDSLGAFQEFLGPEPEAPTKASDGSPEAQGWEFATFANDRVDGKTVDRLNVRGEWEAFARVIVSLEAAPPLAVGLFGDWGTGKSFFMEGLYAEVCALTARAQTGELENVCHHIVQVRFNAWHYMDSVLWSNLVGEVFERLSDYYEEQDDWREARAELIEKLGVAKVQLGEAQIRKDAAEAARRQAQTQVEDLTRQIDERRRELADVGAKDVAAYLLNHPEVKHELAEAGKRLGLPDPKPLADQVAAAHGRITGLGGRLRTLWLGLVYHPSALLLVVLALIGVPAAVWLIGRAASFDDFWKTVASTVAGLAALVAAVKPWLDRADGALKTLEGAHEALTKAQDEAPSEFVQRKTQLVGQVAALEGAADAASKELEARVAEVKSLDERLEQIRQDRQLADFVRSRCLSDDYRKHEGIVAVVRDDFEQLSNLMARAREEDAQKHASKYIERIVLYIDDLDRCPADRVVEVLQAVHLLLAFPLFVVVVGIDPNWMRSSLNRYYREQMGLAPGEGGVPDNAPQRYLEKIFQIPFALAPMDEKASRSLMRSLVPDPAPSEEKVDSPSRPSEPVIDPSPSVPVTPVPTPSPVASVPLRYEAKPMRLDKAEHDLLLALAPLAPSPRAMKRLVNTYHLIRALPSERSDRTAALYALVILVCAPGGGAGILDRIQRPGGTVEGTLSEIRGDASVTQAQRDFLRRFGATVEKGADLQAMAEWIPLVRRFSFD